MKHNLRSFAVLLAIVAIVGFMWTAAHAADVQLNAKIERAVVKLDKNGAEYVQMFIPLEQELNGVKYSKTVPAMAFSSNVDLAQAKAYKAGDILKAIAEQREYNGRTSFTILKLLK